jgi:hypothetical protein
VPYSSRYIRHSCYSSATRLKFARYGQLHELERVTLLCLPLLLGCRFTAVHRWCANKITQNATRSSVSHEICNSYRIKSTDANVLLDCLASPMRNIRITSVPNLVYPLNHLCFLGRTLTNQLPLYAPKPSVTRILYPMFIKPTRCNLYVDYQ